MKKVVLALILAGLAMNGAYALDNTKLALDSTALDDKSQEKGTAQTTDADKSQQQQGDTQGGATSNDSQNEAEYD